jgi:hypothetical protein
MRCETLTTETWTVQNYLMCFKRNLSEVAFPQQPIWNFTGNRLVEAHICSNAQATETATGKGIFFTA